MQFLTTDIQQELKKYFSNSYENYNYKIDKELTNEDKKNIVNQLKEDFFAMSEKMDKQVILSSKEFSAILNYRVLNFLINKFYEERCYGYVEKPGTEFFMKSIIRRLSENNRALTGIEINPFAKIGTGFCIVDGSNCVIGERCIIGTNFTIHKDVVLGVRPNDSSLKIYTTQAEKDYNRHPKIGNYVEIKENSKILGNIHIGDNVIIESGCTVLKSMPSNAIISTYQSMQLYRYENENNMKPKIYLIKYKNSIITIKGINLNQTTIYLIDADSHHGLTEHDIKYVSKITDNEISIRITYKNKAIQKVGLLLLSNNNPKLLIELV